MFIATTPSYFYCSSNKQIMGIIKHKKKPIKKKYGRTVVNPRTGRRILASGDLAKSLGLGGRRLTLPDLSTRFRQRKSTPYSKGSGIPQELTILYFLRYKFPQSCVITDTGGDSGLIWDASGGQRYLYVSQHAASELKQCFEDKSKRFVLITLGLEYDEGAHMNFMIYDRNTNVIERFAPEGKPVADADDYDDTYDEDYDWETHVDLSEAEQMQLPVEQKQVDPDAMLDEALRQYFRRTYRINYLSPAGFCPTRGFQTIQIAADEALVARGIQPLVVEDGGVGGGFCTMWSFFYAHIRLLNPDIPRDILQKRALDILKRKPGHLTQFIINYSTFFERLHGVRVSRTLPEFEQHVQRL